METKRLKIYTVILDGIDKSGKDTIANYVWRLDKKLNVFVRGWPSLVAYAKKFSRNCKYDKPWKNVLYVYCKVDEDDWKLRCNITHEDTNNIQYVKDVALFDEAFETLDKWHYHTLYVNTSKETPYIVAKKIVEYVDILNKG